MNLNEIIREHQRLHIKCDHALFNMKESITLMEYGVNMEKNKLQLNKSIREYLILLKQLCNNKGLFNEEGKLK